MFTMIYSPSWDVWSKLSWLDWCSLSCLDPSWGRRQLSSAPRRSSRSGTRNSLSSSGLATSEMTILSSELRSYFLTALFFCHIFICGSISSSWSVSDVRFASLRLVGNFGEFFYVSQKIPYSHHWGLVLVLDLRQDITEEHDSWGRGVTGDDQPQGVPRLHPGVLHILRLAPGDRARHWQGVSALWHVGWWFGQRKIRADRHYGGDYWDQQYDIPSQVNSIVQIFLGFFFYNTFFNLFSDLPIYQMKFSGVTDLSRWFCTGRITTNSKSTSPPSTRLTRWRPRHARPEISSWWWIRKTQTTRNILSWW